MIPSVIFSFPFKLIEPRQLILMGKYDRVEPLVLEKLSLFQDTQDLTQDCEIEAIISRVKPDSPDEEIWSLRADGWTPSGLSTALQFGVTYPELQKKNPIICWNARIMSKRVWRALVLDSMSGDRQLSTIPLNNDPLDDTYRFLWVRVAK